MSESISAGDYLETDGTNSGKAQSDDDGIGAFAIAVTDSSDGKCQAVYVKANTFF